MSTADVLFKEADENSDGYISETEFRNFLTRNSRASIVPPDFSVINGLNNAGTRGNAQNSSFYQRATSYDISKTAGDATIGGGEFLSTDYGNTSNMTNAAINRTISGNSTASQSSAVVQQYETDAQGNFKDSNPQVIRRPTPGGQTTYTQNIHVRFLQPPPVPPPGPLIIKEVRPPQPPPPEPLRVRQQAPPQPQQPPLVLRERPPPKPAVVTAQTVVRNLPVVPIPPRSVHIERLPPVPPKPRDIIIERWIPYGPPPQRKTIVQRAGPAITYPPPRNVVIQYDPPTVRVVRKFQRYGVTREDPDEYIRRHGDALIDTQTLLHEARAAGVVEDISVPDVSTVNMAEASSTANLRMGTAAFDAVETGLAGNSVGSFYESSASSYSTGENANVTGAGNRLGRKTMAYDALFSAADTNADGVLSPDEFQNIGF